MQLIRVPACLLACLLALCFLALPVSAPAETSLVMEPSSLQLVVGAYGWMNSHVRDLGAGVKIRHFFWESTDPDVVVIDSEGKYRAVGRGEAKIVRRIETNDGKTYEAVCDVRVVVPVDHLSFSVKQLVVMEGTSVALPQVDVFPEDADIRTCSFATDHTDIALVRDGVLLGIRPGRATLTASSDERIARRMIRQDTCTVLVVPVISSLKVEEDAPLLLEAGRQKKLAISVSPANVPIESLHFESSDESVCTVNAQGFVTGTAPGEAEICAWTDQTAKGRLESRVTVQVFRSLQRLALSVSAHVIHKGESVVCTASCEPGDANVSSFRWETSHPYVADFAGPSPDTSSASIVCSQVGVSTVSCTAIGGNRKRASIRLRVETDRPLSVRSGKLSDGGLLLTVKNRMWATAIKGMVLRLSFLDGNGQTLSSQEPSLTGLQIPAAQFQDLSLPLSTAEIPPQASSLAVTVLVVHEEGRDWTIPEERQENCLIPLPAKTSPRASR